MNTQFDQFSTRQKAAVDTTLAALMNTWESAERLAALNLSTARSLLDDVTARTKALLSASNPEEFLAIQAEMVEPLAQKSVSYCRECYEIVAQSVEQASKPVEQQIAELNKVFGAELEKVAKSAPVGSEAALAAVRSGIAAANSTYDQMTSATRQVVELAEANVAAATDAAVKAVSRAPSAARRRKSA